MTTIAWDGNKLACDSQIAFDQEKYLVMKMHLVPNGLATIAGVYCYGMAIIEWLRGDRDADKYPKNGSDSDSATVIVVTHEKELFVYTWYSYIPIAIKDRQFAFGSGGMAARAAMLCGKNAHEAVLIASQIDTGTNASVYVGDPKTQYFSALST